MGYSSSADLPQLPKTQYQYLVQRSFAECSLDMRSLDNRSLVRLLRSACPATNPRSHGPGWSGADIPMKNILHLHNWVADKIHSLDPKALVSTGSWNSLASTNVKGDDPVHKAGFNHYSDGCLYEAGGRNKGIMDFIQFHAYPWAGS